MNSLVGTKLTVKEEVIISLWMRRVYKDNLDLDNPHDFALNEAAELIMWRIENS